MLPRLRYVRRGGAGQTARLPGDRGLWLDDGLCQGVLPYGLAAHLLLDENPDVAAFFNQRYAELLSEYRRGIPAASEDIQDLYGGIEYGQFARWD